MEILGVNKKDVEFLGVIKKKNCVEFFGSVFGKKCGKKLRYLID